jgi:SOS-response transcriptional repressor LexA
MPQTKETTLQRRLRERMELKQLKPAPLATSLGLGVSFIRDILRGKTASPSAANLAKLAAALDTTPAFLLGATQQPELTNRKPVSSRGIPYRGEVAAGIWIEVGEGVLEPDEWLPINPLPQYPEGSVYCLTVRGDSLDKVAQPGSTLVCVDLYESGIQIKDGDLVIVERAKAQSGLLEMTAKRVRTVKGGFELYPESTNPKWKPVTYPRAADNDTGETIRILARVEFILKRP